MLVLSKPRNLKLYIATDNYDEIVKFTNQGLELHYFDPTTRIYYFRKEVNECEKTNTNVSE